MNNVSVLSPSSAESQFHTHHLPRGRAFSNDEIALEASQPIQVLLAEGLPAIYPPVIIEAQSLATKDYAKTWEAMKVAIAATYSIVELFEIRDQAESIRYVLQVAKESPEVVRQAIAIKLRAERKAGEVLSAMPKQGPGDYRRSNGAGDQPLAPSYAELGIDKVKASQCQRIASVPEKKFEAYIGSGDELSTAGALRLARGPQDFAGAHRRKRERQVSNDDSVHHPHEKIDQIRRVLPSHLRNLTILELFSGGENGNLTPVYSEFGSVESFDKKLGTGDSFLELHRLIHEKRKYDVVDIDPYGFPNRMFPHAYQLIDDGYLFVTMPKPHVQILNAMTAVYLESVFGVSNPSEEQVEATFRTWGLWYWREVVLLDTLDLGSVWRFTYRVRKVKATEYTGTRNR